MKTVLLQLGVALDRPRTPQVLLLRTFLYHIYVRLGTVPPPPDLVVSLLDDMHAKIVEEIGDGLDVGMHVPHVTQPNQLDLLALVDLLAVHPLV